MQKAKVKGYVRMRIPIQVVTLLNFSLNRSLQYIISDGRLIIEPIEGDQDLICPGVCCCCPAQRTCEESVL